MIALPPYPYTDSGVGRVYEALRQAGDDGLDRVGMARVFYGVDEPSLTQIKGVNGGTGRLRDWLRRHDLEMQPTREAGVWGARYRIGRRGSIAPATAAAVEQTAGRPAHATRVVGGQRISLPRLSCLAETEARPC